MKWLQFLTNNRVHCHGNLKIEKRVPLISFWLLRQHQLVIFEVQLVIFWKRISNGSPGANGRLQREIYKKKIGVREARTLDLRITHSSYETYALANCATTPFDDTASWASYAPSFCFGFSFSFFLGGGVGVAEFIYSREKFTWNVLWVCFRVEL